MPWVAGEAVRGESFRILRCRGGVQHVCLGASVPPCSLDALNSDCRQDKFALGTLRLSAGRHTTVEEAEAAVELVLGEVRAQGLL